MEKPDPRPSLRLRLATAHHVVRRVVLGHRRGLSAVLVAVAVFAVMRSVDPPAEQTVSVLSVGRDLPAGTVLTIGDVVETAVAPGALPDGLVKDPVGRTLATPARRGELLTGVRLIGPGLLRGAGEDQVALPVRIADADTVALLRVGDRVDLLAADPASAEPTGVSLARGVRVIALPAADPGGAASAASRGRLVVIEVSPEVAEIVTAHAARGLLGVAIEG
jgi:pilus assembly protein CpaB